MASQDHVLLGDYDLKPDSFPDLKETLKSCKEIHLQKLIDSKCFDYVNRKLLELIQKAKEPAFLLPAVIEYIDAINQEKIIDNYNFVAFEFWLNFSSGLSDQENLAIRAKIVGQKIQRDDYQCFFPIGMGKRYAGPHFVTAHGSPDLDTTIASFWGWVDAFGARVQPELWTEVIFQKVFDALVNGGVLVTYAAKGSVRRAMQHVGFTVERLPGPPGKREMLRATKQTP